MEDKQIISTEPDIASSRRSDRELSSKLAVADGLTLTDDHWEVIEYLRAYYLDNGKPESARVIADA